MGHHRQSSTTVGWDRVPARHHGVALLAVVFSLALHAIAISRFPPVPVGRLPDLEESTRIRPVVLGDVRMDARPEFERPPRFQPRDPALLRADPMPISAFEELLAEWIPPDPIDPLMPLAGEDAALAEPVPPTEREQWDARQDLLHIRDRIVPDDVAALPRRMLPAVDRLAMAPDLALPTASADAELRARGEGWLRTQQHAEASEPEDHEPAAPEPSTRSADPLDALPEDPEDIREVAAIEKLLTLELTTFTDPADPAYRYFQIQIRRAGAEVLPVLPRDILLIQDASASMTQQTIDQCKIGMHEWLQTLGEGDRFDLWAFRDELSRAFGRLTPFDPRARIRAATFIEQMRAEGGTDVFASLAPLLELEVDPGRPVIAILVSDGIPTTGVIDSNRILEQFSSQNAGRVSVFTVGGGLVINEYLLDFLSYKNRGDAIMTRTRSELPTSLAQMAAELQRPVLTFLRWQVAGAEGIEIYPTRPTHLFLDRPLSLFGRVPNDQSHAVIQIIGQSGEAMKDMLFPLNFEQAREGSSDVQRQWAWQKIYHLVGLHIQTGSDAVLQEIRAMAEAYALDIYYGRDMSRPDLHRRFRFHGPRAD